MSRPAFRPQRRRTVKCPICHAPRLHPCTRLGDDIIGNGWAVSPHRARLRLEAKLKADANA